MVVVMVDGWPTDRVEEASRLARESGINIFFVTIEAAAENEGIFILSLYSDHNMWHSRQLFYSELKNTKHFL